MSSLFFVDFAQLKIITVLLPIIGYSYMFLFFVFISIIFFIFTILYVIETKIRTVDEIYEDLKTHGKSSRKTVESRAQTDVLLTELNTVVVKPLACMENNDQNELWCTVKWNKVSRYWLFYEYCNLFYIVIIKIRYNTMQWIPTNN